MLRILLPLAIIISLILFIYYSVKKNKSDGVNIKNSKKASERLGIEKQVEQNPHTQKPVINFEIPSIHNPKLDPLIEDGKSSLISMLELKQIISDTEIQNKIDNIINLTNKILEHAIEDSDDIPQIKKFFKYYLPTTVKLLTSYQNMESQCIEGVNISDSKAKIKEMLDIAIKAYENRLDSLFENQALDIETDIDVMNQLLNKEGLLNNREFQLKEGTTNV